MENKKYGKQNKMLYSSQLKARQKKNAFSYA